MSKIIFAKTTPILIALCALTVVGCASQPERGSRGGPPADRGGAYQGGIVARPLAILLTGMDEDRDYKVSGEELSVGIRHEWSNLSGDVADSVSAIELGDWAKLVMGSAEAMPSSISFDTDLNARITALEFGDRMRAEFSRLDKDKNGILTRAELISRLPAPNIQGGQSDGRKGRGGGGRGEGPPRR